jgi:hypothetical protein
VRDGSRTEQCVVHQVRRRDGGIRIALVLRELAYQDPARDSPVSLA